MGRFPRSFPSSVQPWVLLWQNGLARSAGGVVSPWSTYLGRVRILAVRLQGNIPLPAVVCRVLIWKREPDVRRPFKIGACESWRAPGRKAHVDLGGRLKLGMMAFEMVEKAKDLGMRKQATTQGNKLDSRNDDINHAGQKKKRPAIHLPERSVRAPEVIDTIHEGMAWLGPSGHSSTELP